jgi:hypothetical protein
LRSPPIISIFDFSHISLLNFSFKSCIVFLSSLLHSSVNLYSFWSYWSF